MLNEQDAPKYWRERADKLGETAVGYGDKDINTQDNFYKERTNFIFSHIARDVATLDYGCGIGRYADEFTGDYVGYDITPKLINIAATNHPTREFVLLHNPFFDYDDEEDADEFGWFGYFFTATVLQHCSDELVLKILRSVFTLKPKGFQFCLYENSMPFQKPHIIGRHPERYSKIVRDAGFKIVNFEFHPNIVKGEEHSLILIGV